MAPRTWQSLVRCWMLLMSARKCGSRIQFLLARQWIQVWRQFSELLKKLTHSTCRWTLVFQRNAWFDSGFMLMRLTTEALLEVAALAVDPGSGMCFAGLLVRTHLALCSLLVSSDSRCSASWSVWTRRTVMLRDGGPCCLASWLVLWKWPRSSSTSAVA